MLCDYGSGLESFAPDSDINIGGLYKTENFIPIQSIFTVNLKE
jgi:hypothetical protein